MGSSKSKLGFFLLFLKGRGLLALKHVEKLFMMLGPKKQQDEERLP